MGRPERELNPEDGPVVAFACALRELRARAGLTYAALSRRAHMSTTTLSQAAGGRNLPTWPTVEAFVTACEMGEDLDTWQARYAEVCAFVRPADQLERAQEELPVPPRRRRVVVLLAAAGTVAASVVVLGVLSGEVPHDQPTADSAVTARFLPTGEMGAQAVADGADPKRTHCAADLGVSTLDSVEINASDEHFLGVAELRFAPGCRVAWGRFTPAEGSARLAGSVVTITARRVRDTPTSTQYGTAFDGQAVFGNILPLRGGCVDATVQIAALSGNATATTHCLPAPP